MSAAAQTVVSSRSRSAKPKPSSAGWRDLNALLPYLARYKGMTALGLLMLTLMGVVGSLPQLLIGMITDLLKGAPQPLSTLTGTSRQLLHPLLGLYAPLNRHALGAFCLILIGVMVAKGFFSFWTRWILIGVSREIEYDLRNHILSRLLKLEPEFYVRNRTGDLMSRATNDLNNVRMVLGPGIMYTATTIATMAMAIFFMVNLSAALTFWVLLPVPLIALAVRFFGQTIHRLSERIQAALGVLSTRTQENLTGIRVIRAYVQEKAEIESFDRANREYVDQNIELIGTMSLFFPMLSGFIGLTVVILLGFGGIKVAQASVSLGTFLAFYAFVIQLTFPMVALGWVTNIFQRGAASMRRLNYILAAEPNIADSRPAILSTGGNGEPHVRKGQIGEKQLEIKGDIEFRHLTFTYPTAAAMASPSANGDAHAKPVSMPVLSDISLHIPAGSTLAIVGPTGSGKSTIAALIARLWEVPNGTLLIDGRSIREYPLDTLRRSIGYVPQDTFLFSETIRENIGFGVEDHVEHQILGAAEIASICREIESFPQQFETMVGERGITLSGGQKQRTALARALIRKPKILILDDSLASVDTDTEERILSKLKEIMRERTTILVAHRVSTVKNADQIIVLREGRIVERGTHEQLLAERGYYADLYHKQLLEEELERE